MARDEDPSGGKVKAPVPLVIRGVPEVDTESGAGVQLVGRSGSGVGVTRTPKNAKVIVPRRCTEEGVVWRRSGTGSGRKAVEEVGGGVQSFSPETSRERGLKQKGAHGVVGGANHPLSLAILGRGIRARHAQLNTVREKKGTGGGVIKLTTIVTLDGLDGEAELCGHPSEEVQERGESVRLRTQGKSPRIMRKIIDHHKIILVTRNTDHRRCS
jgi:hypothetical protein